MTETEIQNQKDRIDNMTHEDNDQLKHLTKLTDRNGRPLYIDLSKVTIMQRMAATELTEEHTVIVIGERNAKDVCLVRETPDAIVALSKAEHDWGDDDLDA